MLDPIVAIRRRIALEPQQSATIDMVFGIGETREACLALAGKYQDRHLADRVFDLASTHSWVTLRQINATESDAQLYGRLASSVLYANAALRADAGVLMKNRRGQSGLWGYAISGDLPIVLLRIGDAANIDLVRQLVQAHAYWRLKGLAVDLVIWNEDHAGYRQLLQDQITGLIAAGIEAQVMERPGGIFVRRAEQISDEDRILFESVARAVISDKRGTLAEQISREARRGAPPRRARRALERTAPAGRALRAAGRPAARAISPFSTASAASAPTDASTSSRLRRGHAHAGAVGERAGEPALRQRGLGERPGLHLERERPRVPAHPLEQRCGERGERRSLLPARRRERRVLVADAAALRRRRALRHAARLRLQRLRAHRGRHPLRAARLRGPGGGGQIFGAEARQPLGPARAGSPPPATSSGCWATCGRKRRCTWSPRSIRRAARCYATNAYNTEFADRAAFFHVDDATRRVSGNRTEFLGRNGSLGNPAAMRRAQLSNKVGAGLDPCGALQVAFELADGQEREIVFTARHRRGADRRRRAPRCEKVQQYWERTLGAVQVETPDRAFDLLANGWLLYQTLACRLWGRSGHYQSGGAFGFRDQLQDVMALLHAEPRLAREHLLRCAAHQFRDGDVQHWWHPPSGRGVRTHCSDDYLWLPWAASRYVLSTGDAAVLDEPVHFLDGRAGEPRGRLLLRPARALERIGEPVPALRARHRARRRRRRARAAADRLGRLERRHGPGGRERQGRKRLARLFPP